ncbi:hypothetical protein I4U23_020710 [Adineta vaga]|nr:hypothetical protein I4U23_020710 [Adineta vaga]
MDRQFDCRKLLINLQSEISSEERTLLHFVIGTIVSRDDRDDITLHGTLNIIETLFQQENITENNLDFLIKAFDAINCHSAVRQLRDSCLSRLQESNNKVVKHISPSLPPRFYKSSLTISLFFMSIFMISIFVFCLWVVLPKKLHKPPIRSKTDSAVYIIKKDELCSNITITDGQRISHAQNLSLTYNDHLTSIELNHTSKLICSIEFIYSNHKTFKHQFSYNCTGTNKTLLTFDPTRRIREFTQYFNDKNYKSTYIEGLLIGIGTEKHLYGKDTNNKCKYLTDNFIHWYVEGLIKNNYINGFQFYKYQRLSLNDTVILHINDDLFAQ